MFEFHPVLFIIKLVGLVLRARVLMHPGVRWRHVVAGAAPPLSPRVCVEGDQLGVRHSGVTCRVAGHGDSWWVWSTVSFGCEFPVFVLAVHVDGISSCDGRERPVVFVVNPASLRGDVVTSSSVTRREAISTEVRVHWHGVPIPTIKQPLAFAGGIFAECWPFTCTEITICHVADVCPSPVIID